MIMKKYFETLGLKEGASQEEIESAYTRLSKDLDPKENDNLDFFVEEYNLVQLAYKKLTGINPKSQSIIESSQTSGVSDVFDDSDTLVSILKTFKQSKDPKKAEIIESLEAFKSGNLIYQQALAVLYKKEGVSSVKSDIDKQSISKDPSKQNAIEPSETNTDNPSSPKTIIPKKPKKKRNKWIIASLILILVFGLPYVYFTIKVTQFKNTIPLLTKTSKQIQNESKDFWQDKLVTEHPVLVANHQTDDTNKGFRYEESDRQFLKDSTVKFFIYKTKINIPLYKPGFFQCVYLNAVNSDSKWNHYVVNYTKKQKVGLTVSPYFEMRKKIKRRHRISTAKFDDLLEIVGGLKVFQTISPDEIDTACLKCIKDYTVTHETNTVAIKEFYAFVSQYLTTNSRVSNSNNKMVKNYNSSYNDLTYGMSSSLLAKLTDKLKKSPLISTKTVTERFSGTEDGIGIISYSFKQKKYDLKPLTGYVNEIYAAYYSENSLFTGSTPYSYCYGSSNNGSPSEVIINSSDSDVIVTIKRYGKVYRHAYIKANSNFTFNVADGNYSIYFYYGKGWNPKKFMKNTSCGRLVGGFVSGESVGKDMFLSVKNQYMTYTLTSVVNGNFSPETSSIDEAF